MYSIVKDINDRTKLALKGNEVFIIKKIVPDDIPVVRQLIKTENENLAKVYDIAEVEGDCYMVCEYIQGKTIADYQSEGRSFDDYNTKNLILSICEGLCALHDSGIIHRDITPGNIMIDKFGKAKIIDFGISRLEKPSQNSDTCILGTHGYASPEQFGFKQTDCRSDIYSLGVLINVLKTGCLPNEKTADGVFHEIILKCTELDPDNRFQSVRDLEEAIVKKYKRDIFLSSFPGFRKNKPVLNTFSIIFYLLFTAWDIVSLIASLNFRDMICWFFINHFTVLFPFLIIFNAGNWLDRIPFTKYKSVKIRIIYKVIFTFLSLIIALIFMILSPA